MSRESFLHDRDQPNSVVFAEREDLTWEIEERHLHERYQLHKRLIKDFYYLRRTQMLTRHDKVAVCSLKYKSLQSTL